jgi:hypothetical protein
MWNTRSATVNQHTLTILPDALMRFPLSTSSECSPSSSQELMRCDCSASWIQDATSQRSCQQAYHGRMCDAFSCYNASMFSHVMTSVILFTIDQGLCCHLSSQIHRTICVLNTKTHRFYVSGSFDEDTAGSSTGIIGWINCYWISEQ